MTPLSLLAGRIVQWFLSLKNGFILANNVDTGEMSHVVAFHLGLHCLPECALTHISLASLLLDISKECIPRSDVSNVCLQNILLELNNNEKYHPTSLKTETDLSN